MSKSMLGVALIVLASPVLAERLHVDPNVGNSTFVATFDAKLGERITATSSAMQCDTDYDAKAGTISGACSVPLNTIKVDNEDTKTEHFQQWVTNKKMDPKECKLEAKFVGVKLGQLLPERPVKFAADVPFTICGRTRRGGGKERLIGTAVLFPPGSYGEAKTVRIRATINHFNRDKYEIGPKYAEGWLSRVQSLVKVVAEEGTIELSLFARAPKEESVEK